LSSSPLSGFMEELEVHSIHPPKYSLRNDLGQLDEVIASIEEKGLLEPIVVRPVGDGLRLSQDIGGLRHARGLGGGRYHAISSNSMTGKLMRYPL